MLLKMEANKWTTTLQGVAQLAFVIWTLVTIRGLQQSQQTVKVPHSDDRFQALEDQLAVANARVEILEEQLEQRSDADRRVRILEDQLVAQEEQLSDLDQKVQWLQEQLAALLNDETFRKTSTAEQGGATRLHQAHRHLASDPTDGVLGVCVPQKGGQLYAVDSSNECGSGEFYSRWAELSLLQEYFTKLRTDISALQTNTSNHAAMIAALQTNTSDNAAMITANADQIRTGISLLHDLRQDMEAVEGEVTTLNTSVSKNADTIDLVSGAVSWLTADMTNLTVDMEEVRTEVFEYDYSKAVFVTSSSHLGDLGGIEGGDAICQQLADTSSLVPDGTYVAWLSNSTVNATDRLDDSARFVNLDGSLIAGGLQELLSGSLDTGIVFDDTGEQYYEWEGSFVWTGTTATGMGTSHHCNDWEDNTTLLEGEVGIVGAATSSWSSFTTFSCRGLRRLICFSSVALRDASPITGRPSRVETLEANMTNVMESVEALSDQVGVLETSLATLNISVPNSANTINMTNVMESVETLSDQVGAVETSLATLNTTVSNNADAINMVNGTLSWLTADVTNLTADVEGVKDLRRDMGAVESSLTALNTSVANHADAIDMVNGTVFWLAADVTNLTVDMEDVKTEVFEYDYSKAVFVTSSSHRGDFGGIEGGDAICQQLADASSLVPEGVYVAWLSGSTVNATDRLEEGARFVNLDGSLIAGGLQELLSGSLDTGVVFDDRGQEYNETDGSFVWTGTSAAGVGTSHHCNDWTDNTTFLEGEVGIVGAATSSWSSFTTFSCQGLRRLLCFSSDALRDASRITGRPSRVETLEANLTSAMESVETLSDRVGVVEYELFPTAPPTPTPLAPAYVFVTSTEFDNGNLGGLDAADAICQSLADAAGISALAGGDTREYKAWLSNGTLSVNDRFNKLYDESYILVDGTVIATDWDDLTDGTLGTAISKNENGQGLAITSVWTGTDAYGDSASDHCHGWTSDASGTGEIGKTNKPDSLWSSGEFSSCNKNRLRLFCFAQ